MFKRGIVHAYGNVGGKTGWVLSVPDRSSVGREKREPVDEARHEAEPNTIHNLD